MGRKRKSGLTPFLQSSKEQLLAYNIGHSWFDSDDNVCDIVQSDQTNTDYWVKTILPTQVPESPPPPLQMPCGLIIWGQHSRGLTSQWAAVCRVVKGSNMTIFLQHVAAHFDVGLIIS